MSAPANVKDRLNEDEEAALRRTLIGLRAQSVAIAAALLCGIGLFVATNVLVLRGGEEVGTHLGLLAAYFPGYRVTFVGSLIGFAYASFAGYLVGFMVATLYNRFDTSS